MPLATNLLNETPAIHLLSLSLSTSLHQPGVPALPPTSQSPMWMNRERTRKLQRKARLVRSDWSNQSRVYMLATHQNSLANIRLRSGSHYLLQTTSGMAYQVRALDAMQVCPISAVHIARERDQIAVASENRHHFANQSKLPKSLIYQALCSRERYSVDCISCSLDSVR